MLRLRVIQANMTEVMVDNLLILFSYNTAVAYKRLDNGCYYVTKEYFSRTTRNHISLWVEEDAHKVIRVDQELIESVLER